MKLNQKEYEYCLRCGRKLRSEETRKRGYGIICFKKMKVNQRNRLFTITQESRIIGNEE